MSRGGGFRPPPPPARLGLRSIKAYLCPNMIIFDVVDLSDRRPEEVSFDAQFIIMEANLGHQPTKFG